MAANFDRTDRASIFKYSTGLIDHCLRDFANEEEILQLPAGDKGKLGKLVEYLYFKYPVNNNPEADFAEAGMELKCTGVSLPMPSNKYLYRCVLLLVSVLLYPLLGVLLLGTCLSNKFHNLGTSTLGSLAYGNTNILEAIQSRTHRLRLLVRLAYETLQQKVLKVFAGRSLLNPPHAIFVIKEKLALADTRIADVARMLKITMLRVEIPPMCGNDATAYTHPAFVFNIGMGNQKFAEFNRCNPIHRK